VPLPQAPARSPRISIIVTFGESSMNNGASEISLIRRTIPASTIRPQGRLLGTTRAGIPDIRSGRRRRGQPSGHTGPSHPASNPAPQLRIHRTGVPRCCSAGADNVRSQRTPFTARLLHELIGQKSDGG
jgi:hypothetical protein